MDDYYDDEESEGDALIDQNLQEKLDRIKQNLKDTSSIPIGMEMSDESSGLMQRERTLKNMEDVLKRQRERLENLGDPLHGIHPR